MQLLTDENGKYISIISGNNLPYDIKLFDSSSVFSKSTGLIQETSDEVQSVQLA